MRRLPCTLLAAVLAVFACGETPRERPRPAFDLDGPAPEAGAAREPGPSAPSASPPSTVLAAPEELPTVVFLGDSLSAGLHLASDQAFPAVLRELLARRGLPFRLVNAGVSGDTTAGGLARLDWLLRQEPDVVVVELGGNDGLRGLDPGAIEANLREIVARARGRGARVLLLGMVLPPNYGGTYTEAFAALYARVAEDLEVDLVPFFLRGVGGVPELNLPDGLHPTAEGHRVLAENLEPALARLLEELRDTIPPAEHGD